MSEVLNKLDIELKESNFDFMKLDYNLSTLNELARQAELNFALELFNDATVNVRKLGEQLTEIIIDLAHKKVPQRANFDEKLSILKSLQIMPTTIIDAFYTIKQNGNKGAHTTENDEKSAYESLKNLRFVLAWYMQKYSDVKMKLVAFTVPTIISRFKNNQERKIIYIQSADNSSGHWTAFAGAEKIGETTAPAEDWEQDWSPNSEFLRGAAEKRIKSYMRTAGVPFQINWSELAWIKEEKRWFGDAAVHEVLLRSDYKRKEGLEGQEWFEVDLETAKAAIKAVKEGRKSLKLENKSKVEIVLRDEQIAAVEQATTAFKKHKKVLWNAKMRFGKTLSTYELIKRNGYKKVLVMTHRPVVSDSWFDDFKKLDMAAKGYEFGSKTQGEGELTKLLKRDTPFIYFASIQDLRGAEKVGGSFSKNSEFFETEWDLIVVDEAHEGTQTERGDKLYEELTADNTKMLELSGTPFNILNEFSEEQVFTWDYIMEQQAKIRFAVEHPEAINPYESLPEVEMYTFSMPEEKRYQNSEKYFDFAEFFKVDAGKFVHEVAIKKWLDRIASDGKTKYPFSTKEYRESIRHTLWLLPRRDSAAALKKILDMHSVFKEYKVLNIVNDNDDDVIGDNDPDLERVRAAITERPHETKTITLTVRKLTTGVNIPALNAVIFLNNTTSAQNYLQAAFRAQTPFSDEVLGIKKKAYIFDFAPDRALNILAKSVSMSPKAGALNKAEQKEKLGTLLNFLPVLEQDGNEMKSYSIDKMMRQLKKAYAEKAVLSGFDDTSIYNDELWKVSQEDVELFNTLNGKLGQTKQTKRTTKIDVNHNGLDEQQREQARRAKRKQAKERTPEEKALIEAEDKARKERSNMIAILRGVSIRIPLMIYGTDLDVDKDITLDDFVKLVDDISWEEFMPKGITKADFVSFKKFYDPEIFIEAGHRIRQAALSANNLTYQERIEKITTIFSGFKNPDKETVLTPWRVVNLQLGETLGGCNFFDKAYKEPLDNAEYRIIDKGEVTAQVFAKEAKILEINSKTGLYPLYMAFNIYQRRWSQESQLWSKAEWTQKDKELWQEVLENNIYVINKTPMARTITYRTLNGYEKNDKVWNNLIYVKDLTTKLKKDVEATKTEILNRFGGGIMKFDAIVGNPPYQIMDGETKMSASPIYNKFIEYAINLSPNYISMITPARWYVGGKGLEQFRNKMLGDGQISTLVDFPSTNDVFPTVEIAGGVSYFLWEKDYKDKCLIVNYQNGETTQSYRYLNEYDVFIRSNKAISIIEKVQKQHHGIYMNETVSVSKPFGLRTNYKPKREGIPCQFIQKIGLMYAEPHDVQDQSNLLNKWKFLAPRSPIAGQTDFTKPVGFYYDGNTAIVPPGTCCTESFIVLFSSDSKEEVEFFKSYLFTKTVRFLLLQCVASQDVIRDKYRFVPYLGEYTRKYTDQFLCELWGITKEEWEYIDSRIHNYQK